MPHVVHDVQQQYLMKQARSNMMAADTTYIILYFKQKFWARGFKEGGDAYYGKRVCYGLEWVHM